MFPRVDGAPPFVCADKVDLRGPASACGTGIAPEVGGDTSERSSEAENPENSESEDAEKLKEEGSLTIVFLL